MFLFDDILELRQTSQIVAFSLVSVCPDEILSIAYKWAKLKILLEALKEKKLDASFVTEKVNTIKNKLEEFKAIRIQCSNIETANEEIRTISRRAEKGISEQLSVILESLRADS
jgi:hypothetical protein